MDYDPEVPAGYQDADLLQAQYEEEGRALAADRKRGICHHGWLLGAGHRYSRDDVDAMRRKGAFPDRTYMAWGDDGVQPVETYSGLNPGEALCLDCGEVVPDPCP